MHVHVYNEGNEAQNDQEIKASSNCNITDGLSFILGHDESKVFECDGEDDSGNPWTTSITLVLPTLKSHVEVLWHEEHDHGQ